MELEKKKKRRQPGKFRLILKLFKRNFISLHHLVWGRGWKRFTIAVVITLILITALMIFTLEVTSQPKFCNTCHVMKPYYESWRHSTHKDVTCTDCHFPPGVKNKIKGKFTALSMLVNYFTGVYKKSKPWAEISDESCMRSGCHQTRLLQSTERFKENIRFDHAPHLNKLRRGKKLRCTSCHSQIVQGSHISVTETTCFLCHFKQTKENSPINACDRCHKPPVAKKGENSNLVYDHTMVVERKIQCQKCHGSMIVGDGSVPKNRCNMCHADREKIKMYSNSDLMHKNHITDHKIECDQCHLEVQHKSVSRTENVKPDCHTCHPDFHHSQLNMFTGKGGKGIPEYPSHMYLAGLNCQACHIYLKPARFKERGEYLQAHGGSCKPCHGPGYDKLLDTWKGLANRKLSQISNVLTVANRVVDGKKNKKGYSEAKEKLESADYNYKFVKYGTAVHNIVYATRLLDKAYRFARESLQDVGSKRALPAFDLTENLVPGECSNCHIGLEKKVSKIFGWEFSHIPHVKKQKLSCHHCHSQKEKHGQLVIGKQDCMNCHHKTVSEGKETSCQVCHDTQQSIYSSQLAFFTYKIPNVMIEAVTCRDCHQHENNEIVRPGKSVCSNCHEKEYEEMYTEWESVSIEKLNQLREKVKKEKLKQGDLAYDVLQLLEKDGSRGIHNPELYETLLEEALK